MSTASDSCSNIVSELSPLFQQMKSISLQEMKQVQLMNRIDSKFMMRRDRLTELFSHLTENYYIQIVNGSFVANYRTVYYDTPDISMYTAHHNKRKTRQKIRTRCYVDSGTSFCEIKNKSNKGRTNKLRIAIPGEDMLFLENDTNNDIVSFVDNNLKYRIENLLPQVETTFQRITIVNYEKTERITIDCNLSFYNYQTRISDQIPGLVIMEIKQDGMYASYFKNVLFEMRVKPKGISKYCLGTLLTKPDAKKNNFLPKLRYISKL
ncbi:MAG: polyphosphate polymerase domain-containing protein, partial [Bacteroidales bacterium]|nr:polyphosphate polymerase domain-containing protein [Bacteroidales bacterium]